MYSPRFKVLPLSTTGSLNAEKISSKTNKETMTHAIFGIYQ